MRRKQSAAHSQSAPHFARIFRTRPLASSSAWLNPLWRLREGCNGTGATMAESGRAAPPMPGAKQQCAKAVAQVFPPVKFQMKNSLAQIPGVEPIAPRHVEFLFALPARAAERVDRVRCLRGGERETTTFTGRAEPGLKAFPACPTNGCATRVP